MLKAGVVGAGHLGKIHLKLLQASEKYELIGFHDADPENAKRVENEFGYRFYADLDALLADVDVIDIVTPTFSHYEVAKKAIAMGKHTFIEKPVTNTLEEANALLQASKERSVQVQVGHVERFNPAFTAALPFLQQPKFIETHRLAEFNPRGTDVPVVLDLMIHDIDVILSVVKSPVKEIRSSGVSVISDTPDIANARVVFENGCVANITTSRISMKNMRKSRFFQKDAYVSVDFLEKKTEIIRMENAPENPDDFAMILENAEGVRKEIKFEYPEVTANNAILDELESFAASIAEGTTPKVSLEQGRDALAVALQVIENFESNTKLDT